ncbi:MAG TPA: IclR family transcriptional regulator [Gammaproteobacteria bacterium]|nr:IclR family transcriptional regulator [Gammaproteobacteria bacterium]
MSYTPLKPLVLEYQERPAELSEDRKFVTALARGLDVLRAFQTRIGPMSNKQLAEVTGIPKPTISRLTFTLKELGYLTQASRNGKYALGAGVLSLGYPLLCNLRVRHIAHDHMAELARLSGCTIALAICDHLNMVFVDECCGNPSTTLRIDVGARIEIANSAIGRAYLAGLKPERREQILTELAGVHGERWPELHERIQSAIVQVDERGFCLVDGEWRRNTRTVAAPLVSPDGDTVMAMSCGGPIFSISLEMLEKEYGPRLAHICAADSVHLGG